MFEVALSGSALSLRCETREMAGFHHVELWVADLVEARAEWGWLLTRLGFVRESTWPDGESWSAGGAYLTVTTSPNLSGSTHDRRAPG